MAGAIAGHCSHSPIGNLCIQSVFLLVAGWNTLSLGPQVTRHGVISSTPDSDAGSEEICDTL